MTLMHDRVLSEFINESLTMYGNNWFLCFFWQLWESKIGQVKMGEIAQALLLCYSFTLWRLQTVLHKTEENNSFKEVQLLQRIFPTNIWDTN